jgi:hypothetical protein
VLPTVVKKLLHSLVANALSIRTFTGTDQALELSITDRVLEGLLPSQQLPEDDADRIDVHTRDVFIRVILL